MDSKRQQRYTFTCPSPSEGVVVDITDGGKWWIYNIEERASGERFYHGVICFRRRVTVKELASRYPNVVWEPYTRRTHRALASLGHGDRVAGPFYRNVPSELYRCARTIMAYEELGNGATVDDIIARYPNMRRYRKNMLGLQLEMQRREDLVNQRRIITPELSDGVTDVELSEAE